MRHPELARALEVAAAALGADGVEAKLERPAVVEHGDLATNLAMVLAGRLKRKPRELAQELIERLDLSVLEIESAEIAGPGFINFTLSRDYLRQRTREIAKAGRDYGRGDWGAGHAVNVEFVSANPTGPLHSVQREFYVNDAGAQIEKLVDSVHARCRQLCGQDAEIPEGGYHGEYVTELARELQTVHGQRLGGAWGPEERREVRGFILERMQADQRDDMRAFRVEFDEFRTESAVYDSGQIDATLAELDRRGLLYEREGARWLSTSSFGDDKDRVLVKSDGSYTYFLPDIAYHRDKAVRGFNMAIDVWGGDHHGYVPRMKAAVEALGIGADFFEAVIVQLVRVERGGEEVKFSKRAGEFVTLRDLIDEVGTDVTRYFFLERGSQQQMVFDLDLAKERSEKNPVYKVQYAHARLRSVYRRGGIDPEKIEHDVDLVPIVELAAFEMIKTLLDFPEVVEAAARNREPHRVVAHLEELANQLNSWYHAGTRDASLRVLGQEPAVTSARLLLAHAAEIVLRNGLEILGIEAPEQM
jgi:arginyl-tRNA synthetase